MPRSPLPPTLVPASQERPVSTHHTHHLRADISVVIRQSKRVTCDLPLGREYQKIRCRNPTDFAAVRRPRRNTPHSDSDLGITSQVYPIAFGRRVEVENNWQGNEILERCLGGRDGKRAACYVISETRRTASYSEKSYFHQSVCKLNAGASYQTSVSPQPTMVVHWRTPVDGKKYDDVVLRK